MKKKIVLVIIICSSMHSINAQPYLDVASVKYMSSPNAGLINGNKNNYTLSYFSAAVNLPFACKPLKGIFVVNPFFEKWITRIPASATFAVCYQNAGTAISFVDTASTHTWRYSLTSIIRVKDITKDGTSPLQLGIAGLAVFPKNKNFTYKFGFYFNKDYFGDFFMPLAGIDWTIDPKNKLFGILPGSMTFEHKISSHIYYGAAFRAITNSYRSTGNEYFRIDDNQLGFFADVYPIKNIALTAELGHSLFRKISLGEKNIYKTNIQLNDNIYFKLGLAYRIRFD